MGQERAGVKWRFANAANGLIGFVSKERVDGKLILPEAVQIMKILTNEKYIGDALLQKTCTIDILN